MSQSLDFDVVAEGLVRELPEALTAGGAAVLLRADKDHSAPGVFRTTAADGFSPDSLAALESVCCHLPDPIAWGRPHTTSDWVEAAVRAGQDRADAERFIGSDGPDLTYELRHGDERLGLYLLRGKVSGMRYSGEEIALLTPLVNQVGVALKNNMLHRENLGKAVLEEELALARKIQQTFLPSHFPQDLPFEVHGLNIPSKQVGGDYFDFFPIANGGYALAIADVAGKGVPAALLASMLQASLRTLLRDGIPPGRVMQRVNALVCESTNPEQFITLFVAHLDTTKMKLTYCNAGHNYPVFARAGSPGCLLHGSDLVLGVVQDATYCESDLDLEPGDSLLLYTDGVTEARRPDGEEFGEDRLTGLVERQAGLVAAEVVGRIRDELLRFARSRELQDDMTLLYIRIPENEPAISFG
jgi:serine phosphatase RsbU (regulator of sigma subunit)